MKRPEKGTAIPTSFRRPSAKQIPSLAAALALTVLSACSPTQNPVEIPFVATWAGQPLRCSDSPVSLSDLRLYISDPAFVDANGKTHPITLAADSPWQQPRLALVDLEDGEGSCENGTTGSNDRIAGTVAPGEYVALQFTLGVPFSENHKNPLLASAPLDNAPMHWHWRSGYKFLRAGIVTPDDGYWLHLGSTGCTGTVQAISGCRYPNRVAVEIPGFKIGTDAVAIDLSALFERVKLHDGEAGSCSSSPAEASCDAPFAALGLIAGADDGRPKQNVFRLHR